MKTADLQGSELDLWVTRANAGHNPSWSGVGNPPWSTSWTLGGQIIERERIACFPSKREDGAIVWSAIVEGNAHIERYGMWYERPTELHETSNIGMGAGPTPLIAAMRAFVASKFGAEVGA